MDQLELLRCGAPADVVRGSPGDDQRRFVPVVDASAASEHELTALVATGAEVVAMTGCRDVFAACRIAARLAVAEAVARRPAGSLSMIAVVDHPGLATALASLEAAKPRLAALAFDAKTLAGRLGVTVLSAPVTTARGLVSLAAAALELPAFLVSSDEAAAVADGYGGLLRPPS